MTILKHIQQKKQIRGSLLILVTLALLAASHVGYAQKKTLTKTYTPQELIANAAQQFNNQAYQQVIATLSEVDTQQAGINLAEYFTLLAKAQTRLNNHNGALENFKQAINHGQNDLGIYVYLAEIHFVLQDYKNTLIAIDKSKSNFKAHPEILEMKAISHWNLGQKAEAWETIGLAVALFPKEAKYLQQQTIYALDLGLYQQAAESGRHYLASDQAKAEDHVAIGNALRLNRQFESAATLLETAHLRYPQHANIVKVLAHTYIDQGMHTTAANILEEASLLHPEFVIEAAELHKNAGNFQHALFLNAQVADQAKKLKQRIAIYLGLQNYELILNMESNLARFHLLDDQSIRYALAYSAYSIGHFEQAKKHLLYVKEANLFKQATELQRLMQACQTDKAMCS